jgi:protein TonB
LDGGQSPYSRIEDEQPSRRAPRHALAFVASIAAHIAAITLVVLFAPAIERPHSQWVLAYLVVMDSGGGAKGSAAATGAGASAPAPAATAVHPPPRDAHARRQARVRIARKERGGSLPPPREAVPPRADARAATTGAYAQPSPGTDAHRAPAPGEAAGAGAPAVGGGGSGSGGDGDGGGSGSASARVEYGSNPAPMYPAQARRRSQQGTVALRILVGVDGRVERVEIVRSSGFDSLDEAAVETVRTRWRFVPAQRDGVAVESWVEVPIRFALTEASSK